MEAVKFAAANQLLLSVRGGGHSLSGQSVCEKGLMIDLSQMNSARVDPVRSDRDHRRRRLVRRARSRGAGARSRDHGRHGVAHRRGRTHARRRLRPSRPALRPGLRQRARHRPGDGGRQVRDCQQRSRTRNCSGGCAAAAAISASPPRSSSSCIRSIPIMLGGELAYSFEDAPAVLEFFFGYAAQAPDELNLDVSVVRLPNDQRFMSHRRLLLRARRRRRKGARAAAPDSQADPGHRRADAVRAAAGVRRRRHRARSQVLHQGRVRAEDHAGIDRRDHRDHRRGETAGGAGGGAAAGRRRLCAREAGRHGFRAARRPAQHVRVHPLGRCGADARRWAVGRAPRGRSSSRTRTGSTSTSSTTTRRACATPTAPNYDRMVALKTKFDPDNLFRLNANVRRAEQGASERLS